MEESNLFHPTSNKNKRVQLTYILNNSREKEGEKMEIIFTNDYNGNDLTFISYEEIIHSFHEFLKKKIDKEEKNDKKLVLDRISYKYIGYFDRSGFVKLEKGDFIFLDNEFLLDNLHIKIIAKILSLNENFIGNKYNKITKEIINIDTKMIKIKNNFRENPFNVVVLTSNPLMYCGEELRTMNDFNIIPATLYKLLKEKDYLKYSDFQPLSIKTFKNVIMDDNKRPDILHLICKSTYNIENKSTTKDEEQSKQNIEDFNLVNLIFENEESNAEFVDRKIIDEIFRDQKMKENVKNMTLIISTELAEDVYNLFQYNDFKFKNILIQHTTPADIDFVSEFNLFFYLDLIFSSYNNLNNIYEDAINTFLDKKHNTFCCCFHKHKKDCNLKKNLIYELFNDNNCRKQLKDLTKIIPHFCHLLTECKGVLPKCDFDDFCVHYSYNHRNYYKNTNYKYTELEPKTENTFEKIVNNCCCYEKDRVHNIDNIFFYNFEKNKNKDIFNESKLVKNYVKDNYIPRYEKMKFLVGKNKIVFEVIKFLNSDDKYNYNIYGDSIENLKVLGNIIIEYYKERYHLYEANKKRKMEFELLDLDNDTLNIFVDKFSFNKIYFIYNYLKENQLTELINKKVKMLNKIIWFSVKQIVNKKIDENKELTPEPSIKIEKEYKKLNLYIPNEYIKFQHDYTVRNIWNKEIKK